MIELITDLKDIDFIEIEPTHLQYKNEEFLFTLNGEELAVDLYIDLYGSSDNEEERFETDLVSVTFGEVWDDDMNIIDLTDYQEKQLRNAIKKSI